MRISCRSVLAGSLALALFAGSAGAQIALLEETTWSANPASGAQPMGAFDELIVALFNPTSPVVGAPPPCVPVAGTAPTGTCGATLWHAEPDCCALGAGFSAPMTSPVAAYNQGDIGIHNYMVVSPTGMSLATRGAIATVGLAGVPARTPPPEILLSFDTIRDTEPGSAPTPNFNSFDKGFVEVRPAPCGQPPCVEGPTWSILAQVVGLQSCAAPITCSIGPGNALLNGTFLGASGKVRFRFESVDGLSNNYCGWMIDNVRLTNEKCNPPCAPGTAFQPRIGSAGGMARPGNLGFAITLSGGPPGSVAFLFMGFQRLPSLPLPFPPGCSLCCSPDLVLAIAPVGAAGGASAPLPIPAAVAPCLGAVCLQWVVVSPGPPLSVTTSSKGELPVQP